LERVQASFHDFPTWGKAVAAAGAALVVVYVPIRWWLSRPRSTPYKKNYSDGIVYVYQFPRCKALPSLSPYCLKLETWLRMADVNYENVNFPWLTVRSSEGTLPFVEYNGREYPDSALIIRDLTAIFSKETMETHLNDEQRVASRALEKLVEHSLWWSFAYCRYLEHFDEMFALMPNIFGFIQPIIGVLLKGSAHKKIKQALGATGIGRHSRTETINIGLEDLRMLSSYLGNKHYFTGFKATRADAAIFGVLAQIIYMPIDTPHKELINLELINLKDFCERIKNRYWPDWIDCTTRLNLHSEWKRKV